MKPVAIIVSAGMVFVGFLGGYQIGNHSASQRLQTRLNDSSLELQNAQTKSDDLQKQLTDMTTKYNDYVSKTQGISNASDTYVVPTQTFAPSQSRCPVTTCVDTTCSNSTGRGTCSWHGGIAY